MKKLNVLNHLQSCHKLQVINCPPHLWIQCTEISHHSSTSSQSSDFTRITRNLHMRYLFGRADIGLHFHRFRVIVWAISQTPTCSWSNDLNTGVLWVLVGDTIQNVWGRGLSFPRLPCYSKLFRASKLSLSHPHCRSQLCSDEGDELCQWHLYHGPVETRKHTRTFYGYSHRGIIQYSRSV